MSLRNVTLRGVMVCCLLYIPIALAALDESDNLLRQYSARFAVMDSLVSRFGTDSHSVLLSNRRSALDSAITTSVDRVTQARLDEMKSRNGLAVTGQVYARPFSAALSADDDDPLNGYNAKAQVAVEWDFLNSSLYKRRQKADLIYLQGQMDMLQSAQDAVTGRVALEKVKLRRQNSSYLLGVLREHSQNLTLLMQTNAYLLKGGRISSDELLALVAEKAELDRQILAIEADSVMRPQLPGQPRSVRVDSLRLVQQVRNENVGIRKLTTEGQMLGVERELAGYGQQVSVAPFARVAYYNRSRAANTQTVDLGVSFRLPLDDQSKKKRRTLDAQRQAVDLEAQRLETQTVDQIRLILADLSSFDDNIRGEFNRMKELRSYLSDRTHSYNNALGGNYSRLQRLKEYNAYLASWERMLQFQMQRDNRLMDLQSFIPMESLQRYLVINTLK